jgi:hypothetical protein
VLRKCYCSNALYYYQYCCYWYTSLCFQVSGSTANTTIASTATTITVNNASANTVTITATATTADMYSLRHPSSVGSQALLGAFADLNNGSTEGGAEEAKTETPETSFSVTANTSAGSLTSTTAAQKPLSAGERFQAFLEQSSKNRSAKAAAAAAAKSSSGKAKGSAVSGATTAGAGAAAVNGANGVASGGSNRVTGVHTLQHPGAANLMLQVLQQLAVGTSTTRTFCVTLDQYYAPHAQRSVLSSVDCTSSSTMHSSKHSCASVQRALSLNTLLLLSVLHHLV